MCGRYTLKEKEENLAKWFEAVFKEVENLEPNYNIAPSQRMPVVRQSEGGDRVIERYSWGLLPFWAKEKNAGYSLINARAETLDSKRSFKPYFQNQRCLIPASGFYEWKGPKGNKTPYYIYPTHEPVFAFAGLYSLWSSPDGETVPTYTIVTTGANSKMTDLHNRMPAMLLKEEWDSWLDPSNQHTDALKDMLDPYPDDALDYHPVSKEVNNVRNNNPRLIEPDEGGNAVTGDLFA